MFVEFNSFDHLYVCFCHLQFRWLSNKLCISDANHTLSSLSAHSATHFSHSCTSLSRSATCTGACRTYFPRPRTRCVDPGSILRDQNKGLIRQPELGCKQQMLASVHHHIQYLICIYTSDQHWEVTPVWKSTKISVSGLFSVIILKELSVLDA